MYLTSSCGPGVNENVRDCLPFNAANSLKDVPMLVAGNLEVCLVTRVNKGTLKCLHVSCTSLRMRSMPSVLNILSCVKSLPECWQNQTDAKYAYNQSTGPS